MSSSPPRNTSITKEIGGKPWQIRWSDEVNARRSSCIFLAQIDTHSDGIIGMGSKIVCTPIRYQIQNLQSLEFCEFSGCQ